MAAKYKDFTVGFHGYDHAVVIFDLSTPRTSYSSRPKDKFNRETFEVKTTTETLDEKSLAERVASLTASGDDAETLGVMQKARMALDKFISENGRTNPHSEADWEDYRSVADGAPAWLVGPSMS